MRSTIVQSLSIITLIFFKDCIEVPLPNRLFGVVFVSCNSTYRAFFEILYIPLLYKFMPNIIFDPVSELNAWNKNSFNTLCSPFM